jgi:hypothetical protein
MDIVTGAALRVEVACGPRRYIIRPPTFGEAAALAAEQAARLRPSIAVYLDALRTALAEAGHAARTGCIDAEEDAEDALSALLATRPDREEPPAAQDAWREGLRAAQQTLLGAQRRRQVAEALLVEHPGLAELRARRTRDDKADGLAMLRLCLCGWSGGGLPEWTVGADLSALPAADAALLVQRAFALLRPDADAAGN